LVVLTDEIVPKGDSVRFLPFGRERNVGGSNPPQGANFLFFSDLLIPVRRIFTLGHFGKIVARQVRQKGRLLSLPPRHATFDSSNKKIKPEIVLINGVAEHHPEGRYFAPLISLLFSVAGMLFKLLIACGKQKQRSQKMHILRSRNRQARHRVMCPTSLRHAVPTICTPPLISPIPS
jgi:hypothetical protein